MMKIIAKKINNIEQNAEKPLIKVSKLRTLIFSKTPKDNSKNEDKNILIHPDHSSDFLPLEAKPWIQESRNLLNKNITKW